MDSVGGSSRDGVENLSFLGMIKRKDENQDRLKTVGKQLVAVHSIYCVMVGYMG
jgi:hypothetical protein